MTTLTSHPSTSAPRPDLPGPGARWRRFVLSLSGLLALAVVVDIGAQLAGLPPWIAHALAGAVTLTANRILRARRRRQDPLLSRVGRSRLKFTPMGRTFVVLTLGVGLAAINTGNNLLYLILGMLLSLIVASGILSEMALRALTVDRQLPREVFARRPWLTGITLANDKRWIASFSVEVEDVIQGLPTAKKCFFLKVPAGARQQTSYRGESPGRGAWRFVGFVISTRFPFGLFRKSRTFQAPADLVVYPAIHPVGGLPTHLSARAGQETRPVPGSGREFHGLKPYREGDDARDIHWKRSAREGRLVLREYEQTRDRRVALYLNPIRPPEAATEAEEQALVDELERGVDLVASLMVHFIERDCPVDLVVGGDHIRVGPDRRGLSRGLRTLALMQFEADSERRLLPPSLPARRVLITHNATRRVAGEGFDHVFEVG